MKKTIKTCYQDRAQDEWRRLIKDNFHRLEFKTTLHFLKKYLPKEGLILDAGGGPGRYTIELAKQGYEVVLLDLTPKLLRIAKKKIKKAKVEDKVTDIVEGSIVDLSKFPDNSFEAVLCLGGPLSHVEGEKKRQKAVSELIRVAKKGAPIFVSVMGRLGLLIETPMYWPDEIKPREHFRSLWQAGDDQAWRWEYYCHFFLPEELKKLFASTGKTEIVDCVGLEGLAHAKRKISQLASGSPQAWRNWQEAHLELCTHPAVFATSNHMMIILKKK
ncbi:MAG: methyltransferase domain-containing protein [Candidatus Pacebacteria bacterium]|nr:methyltransferase domain-containing protein [Candidatus Paceibacterota bacterium]